MSELVAVGDCVVVGACPVGAITGEGVFEEACVLLPVDYPVEAALVVVAV